MSRLRKNVVIFGVLPPPIGGVSIHLQRLCEILKEDNFDFLFIDYKKEKRKIFISILKERIFHLNFTNKRIRFLISLILFFLRKKNVITFHGKYDFSDFFDYWSLKLCSKALVLNTSTYNSAINKGIDLDKLMLISAFIPPQGEEKLTSQTVASIEKIRTKFDFVVCTNANGFVLDKDKNDLYGIDVIIKAVGELSNYGLIISDPSGELYKRYANYKSSDQVLFISTPHPFVNILKCSDYFVRATTTDGDSLSVKEALYFGVKTIVSDCVDRPKGSCLFATGDADALKGVLISAKKLQDFSIENGAKKIIECYKLLK